MLVDAVPFALPQVVFVELLERVIALVEATVTEAVVEEITGEPVSLIETLATQISNRLLTDFPLVVTVVVTVIAVVVGMIKKNLYYSHY